MRPRQRVAEVVRGLRYATVRPPGSPACLTAGRRGPLQRGRGQATRDCLRQQSGRQDEGNGDAQVTVERLEQMQCRQHYDAGTGDNEEAEPVGANQEWPLLFGCAVGARNYGDLDAGKIVL